MRMQFLFLLFLRLFASGEIKATNDLRDLKKCFLSGTVPPSWQGMYVCKHSISLGQWMNDFIARIRALSRYLPALPSYTHVGGTMISAAGSKGANICYWMGGMFLPETYIMATRQHTAHVSSSFRPIIVVLLA
jgi:hypothetical protein